MFDNRWDNWAGDFADSFSASLLSSPVRACVPEILAHFGAAAQKIDEGFPDDITPGLLAKVLTESMPRLVLPDEVRGEVPDVIARFFEYLTETGRLAEGEEFAARIRVLASGYSQKLKPGGGVRGETIRKPQNVSALGRNDPCPCGSGRKFKKCCMTRSAG